MQQANGTIGRMHFVGFQLGFLARALAGSTGLHVIDETGIRGQFIIDLNYVSDEIIAKASGDPAAAASLPGGAVSIFTALEQQLGLRLEKVSGKRGYIVIDRAERPAPNSALTDSGDEAAPPRPQTPGKRPRYDVASIKECEAEENPTGARGTAGGTNATFSPGRFYVPCVTTEQLIYLAYAAYGAREGQHLANDIQGSASDSTKVRGGPSWVHSLRDKYRIEATAQGATDRFVLMGDMLQSLLEDRFKLKLHRETEEVDMLKLVISKDGFKLKPMKDGDCSPLDGGMPDPRAAKPACGSVMMGGDEARVRWTFGGFKISQLANMLTKPAGAHVIDATGLTDKYLYTFEFARDDAAGGATSTARTGSNSVAAPALNTALQEQLGLKLEPTKAPRGYLVIDHIERPIPDGPGAPAMRAAGPASRR
jgi:uncharacterized protein (TIGR03435 family)